MALGAVHVLHENHWPNATDENWSRNRARFHGKWPDFRALHDRLYGAVSAPAD